MSFAQHRPSIKRAAAAMLLALPGGPVWAHASEQGFVLLLPTDVYSYSGAATVALTVLLIAILPDAVLPALFRPLRLIRLNPRRLPLWTSGLSTLVVVWLVWTGLTGPRDPLSNPLTLLIWTIWWIGLVSLQGLFGDLWRWINPWSGVLALIRLGLGRVPPLRLPARLGHVPAIVTFLGFGALLMADPAPADPGRLARFVGVYWMVTLLAALLFGPRWMHRGEGLSVMMRSYARTAPLGRSRGRVALGLPGWRIHAGRVPPVGLALFILILLGSGSFDGLNETFWWLGVLGINPLEFPGRSAVILPNLLGLLAANAALVAVFALTVRLGLMLSGVRLGLVRAICIFAPSILPIALGYHVAHYLPSFLVDSQYALAALNDPFATGADLLGLGTFYVTTGFFNTADSVRVIWLSQAGAVVVGHVLAVILAHGLAVRHFGTARRAMLAHAPLAFFMVGYTLFGLWLLASPRGV